MNNGRVGPSIAAEIAASNSMGGEIDLPPGRRDPGQKADNSRYFGGVGHCGPGRGAYGVKSYPHSHFYEDTDNAFVEGIAVRVCSRIVGQVVRVAVKDNQHIVAGDLLVEIDPCDINNRLNGVRASLKAAEARCRDAEVELTTMRKTAPATVDQGRGMLAAANVSVDTTKARLASAQNTLALARSHLAAGLAAIEESKATAEVVETAPTRAKPDLGRYEGFHKTGGITASQLDQCSSVARATTAAYRAAQRRITVSCGGGVGDQDRRGDGPGGRIAGQGNPGFGGGSPRPLRRHRHR